MKTLRRFAVFTAVSFLLAGNALAQATSVDQIKAPPLRKFAMPQPKRIQLSNGMVIFLQEDHELPLVRGSALIRGGERNVEAGKTGLASIYGQAWRTGGTTSKTGDELDQFLESRAARVETGGGIDSTSVSMDVLKGDFDAVFPIWVDLLRNPAFRQDKIELAKTQANTAISRRNDEPGGILSRELGKLGYGAESPYARQTEYATISSITRDDLIKFHDRFVHPNNIILSFIGDFDAAKVEKKLRDTFSTWAKGPQAPPPVTDITPAKPGVYFVPKEDVTQANIGFVHPGVSRSNPDYYALVVMNEVFSGGFSGRLMQRLRSERGLTYGVGGGVGANWDYPGLFRVQMSTKSGTTLESVDALRGEINKLTKDPVTAAELSLAKESILNAFVFTMDTRAKALGQQVQLEFYGFPADYWQKYPASIEKVTSADVERVAKQYVQPDKLALLVVGNEKEFEKPLQTLGNVQTIDIAIPEPGAAKKSGAAMAAPAGTNAEGKALINKVASFVGNVGTLKSLKRTASMSMNTPQGAMEASVESLTQYPSSTRMVMNMPMGQITRVMTPESGFMITPMGTQDIPSSQRASQMAELRSDLIVVLKNVDNPKYTFTAAGMENNAAVLDINADGSMVKWYVDPATGRVLRTSQEGSAQMPGTVVTEYSDWKNFGGINLPTHTVITRNGEKAAEITVSGAEVNPAVPADAFVKPAGK